MGSTYFAEMQISLPTSPRASKTPVWKTRMSSDVELAHRVEMPMSLSASPRTAKTPT